MVKQRIGDHNSIHYLNELDYSTTIQPTQTLLENIGESNHGDSDDDPGTMQYFRHPSIVLMPKRIDATS